MSPITLLKFSGLLAALTLSATSLVVVAEPGSKTPLVISQDHAWPPLAFQNRDGEPQGLLVDLWQVLGKQMGQPVEFRLVDWPQTIEQVRSGAVPVHGGLIPSPERARTLDFSREILTLEAAVFVSTRYRSSDLTDPALAPLGVIAGSYELEYLREHYPDLPVREYQNNTGLVASATAGTISAFVADYPVGQHLLARFSRPENFHVLEILYERPLVAAVPKGETALLERINTAIETLPEDELSRIINRWIHTDTIEVTPRWLFPALVGITALLVLLFILLYMRALRRQRTRLRQELAERSEQFQVLFENAAISIMVHDRETAHVLEANARALESYGVPDVETLNQVAFGSATIWAEPPYSLADMHDWITRVREQGPQRFEWLTCSVDGQPTWEDVFLRQMQVCGQQRIISTAIDITSRKEAEARLQRQLELEEVVRKISVTLLVCQSDEADPPCVVYTLGCLGEFMQSLRCTLFRYNDDTGGLDLVSQWAAPGIPPKEADFHIPAVVLNPYYTVFLKGEPVIVSANEDNAHILEHALIATDADIREVLALPILREGGLKEVLILSFSEMYRHWPHTDIQLLQVAADMIGGTLARHKLEQELQRQASHDSLTGLYNRRNFEALLLHELERATRYRRQLALILLDIDHFKTVNDRFGHNAGDEVLRQLAVIMREQTRDSDVLARWGGEEFIILLPETDLDGALQAAGALRQAVADTRFPTVGQVTVSLGVSTYQSGDTPDSLIKRADDAMYQAKTAGRNRVRPGPSGSSEY
ncbi:diguanylate cyclase [Thiohalophilus thiocyanatoxydans]|uniref:diguanylate cyclase n=1 Tax=Thiohalophilus thiocyanatoxydans TaxID=381308 RepID=A0A4V6QBZ2_9GAMM|nr:diguanylate cyclase [Thiohalophilus thiocyanatoxydans]TDY03995.1 PAS domain S-box-containing protein/diguanylate cyclase (GGDEF)-like protein [Thiohalophilus thiocyanatoxydans]